MAFKMTEGRFNKHESKAGVGLSTEIFTLIFWRQERINLHSERKANEKYNRTTPVVVRGIFSFTDQLWAVSRIDPC